MPGKTVNFGTSKTGLTTVGYTLISNNGFVGGRQTVGVYEIGNGVYGADIDVGEGSILWDTGEVTPLYASDEQDRIISQDGIGLADMRFVNGVAPDQDGDGRLIVNTGAIGGLVGPDIPATAGQNWVGFFLNEGEFSNKLLDDVGSAGEDIQVTEDVTE